MSHPTQTHAIDGITAVVSNHATTTPLIGGITVKPLRRKTLTQPKSHSFHVAKATSFLLALVIVSISSALFVFSRQGQLFTVISGSMRPGISVGGIIGVVPSSNKEYQSGDIIAFNSSKGVITHRITEVVTTNPTAIHYVTKGDANPTVDVDTVPQGEVLGEVKFSVPLLGYLFAWMKTRAGFAVVILLPATLVVLQELLYMRQAWRNLRARPRLSYSLASVLIVLLFSATSVPVSQALLSDSVSMTGNRISTAAVFPTPSPTPTTSPIPSPSPVITSSPTPSVEPSPTPSPTPSSSPDPCQLNVNVTQSNSNTGPGSTNTNSVDINHDCEVTEENTTTTTTDIDVTANTGNNSSSGNTVGGNISTGDITLNFNVNN